MWYCCCTLAQTLLELTKHSMQNMGHTIPSKTMTPYHLKPQPGLVYIHACVNRGRNILARVLLETQRGEELK